MNKNTGYTIRFFIFLLLIIPIFLNVFLKFFFIREINLFIILILIFGFVVLFILGKIIEIYGYNVETVHIIEKHDVIKSFIKSNNKLIRWLEFLLIMITEELIFRYYLIGIFFNLLHLEILVAIIISSLIFSFYHIHTWFSYKNVRIVAIFLFYSFFLGLYNGYLLLTLGIIPCIFVHYTLAYILYYGIFVRYFKRSSN
ncbi:MAG: type II CAAX prenyl endopeptidase Rce1 family protein [Promethearchaeota archaeon]